MAVRSSSLNLEDAKLHDTLNKLMANFPVAARHDQTSKDMFKTKQQQQQQSPRNYSAQLSPKGTEYMTKSLTTKPSERTLTQFLNNLKNEKERKIPPELAIDLSKNRSMPKKSPAKKGKKSKINARVKRQQGSEYVFA
jgi:hypothetical protein